MHEMNIPKMSQSDEKLRVASTATNSIPFSQVNTKWKLNEYGPPLKRLKSFQHQA